MQILTKIIIILISSKGIIENKEGHFITIKF